MKNVTITLDEETAAWARVHAARHNMSVSRMVGEMLQRSMHEHTQYDQAMRRFLARKPRRLAQGGTPFPSRESLHERNPAPKLAARKVRR
ncbi:MAG: CopG family transcriptional regulator [Burkholderiales bacterium]|nr:CopG family transcriptional regulator [Burkholderiales bacterium]